MPNNTNSNNETKSDAIKSLIISQANDLISEFNTRLVDFILTIYGEKNKNEQYLPISTVSILTGLNKSTINKWIKKKMIKVYKVKGSTMVSLNEVRSIIALIVEKDDKITNRLLKAISDYNDSLDSSTLIK